jgi:hypothetical protein
MSTLILNFLVIENLGLDPDSPKGLDPESPKGLDPEYGSESVKVMYSRYLISNFSDFSTFFVCVPLMLVRRMGS